MIAAVLALSGIAATYITVGFAVVGLYLGAKRLLFGADDEPYEYQPLYSILRGEIKS